MMAPAVVKVAALLARLPLFFSAQRPDPQRQRWEVPTLFVCIAVGAFLRFWGVGSWGLEYDEETMAMPAMHILEDGIPLLPSGMFYARGIAQLYMMAASVRLFGASEFALRLPSVLCGIAVIAIAYPFGRRFLGSVANLCFVAAVALLPGLIADSQEARMYIFMVACLAAFAVFVFRWEASGRQVDLLTAVILAIVGLQFHVLTIFGAFLLYFPALRLGDARKFRQATMAFLLLLICYVLINGWIDHFYPPHSAGAENAPQMPTHMAGFDSVRGAPIVAPVALFASAMLAWVGARGVISRSAAHAVGVLLFLGLSAQALFAWHLGLLLLTAAIVLAMRAGCRAVHWRLTGFLLVSVVILVVQIQLLRAEGVVSARKLLGALVGEPSVWPMLRFSTYSPVALALVGSGLVHAAWCLMRKKLVADVWLFAFLTVWLPLFLIGFFSWDVEPRYGEFALLPALICAFAVAQRIAMALVERARTRAVRTWGVTAIATISITAVVDPLAVARVVNAGYAIHPDHKGAAEYIRSLSLGPNDVLLAEDVNQQTYYLGRVDYWLISPGVAAAFDETVQGKARDIYTHTPVMDSAACLRALLDNPSRGAVYVIGSGENQEDGRLQMRGAELDALLKSSRFEVVFNGRDKQTRVWKATASIESPGHPVQSK